MNRDLAVGVITLDGSFNYGNRLQLFATLRAWESMGCVPTNLRNCVDVGRRFHPKKTIYNLMGKTVGATRPEELSTPDRLAAFARFDERIRVREVVDLTGLSEEYDLFSVGSDQVWNPSFSPCGSGGPLRRMFHAVADHRANQLSLDWYFLSFASPEQRVAIAASIGLDDLDAWQCRLIRRRLHEFGRISVRERRAAELLRDRFGLDAAVLPDPTLTLSAEEWRSVSDARMTPPGPYVFTYLLGGCGAEASAALREVTEGGRLPVVALTDHQQPGEPDAGPAEFIDLVDHAAFVVTDSFHASVFSMLLSTPLVVTRREGALSGMFSRIESLADTYGLWKNVWESPEYDMGAAGDYSAAVEPLRREREKFAEYMRDCLGSLR